MKKIIKAIIFFVLGLGVVIGNYYWDMNTRFVPEKGLFSDVILDKFKEESFHNLSISNKENNFRNSRIKKTTNEILNYFKDFELKEAREKRYVGIYEMTFQNRETREVLDINIVNDSSISVRIESVDKEIKKVSELRTETRLKEKVQYKYYEITNGKIDLKFIEDFYDNKLED